MSVNELVMVMVMVMVNVELWATEMVKVYALPEQVRQVQMAACELEMVRGMLWAIGLVKVQIWQVMWEEYPWP